MVDWSKLNDQYTQAYDRASLLERRVKFLRFATIVQAILIFVLIAVLHIYSREMAQSVATLRTANIQMKFDEAQYAGYRDVIRDCNQRIAILQAQRIVPDPQ